MADELTDAKIAAAEARTDTKFAQVLGKLDLIAGSVAGLKWRLDGLDKRLDGLDKRIDTMDGHVRTTKATIISVVIGSALTIVGLTYAAVQIFESALNLPR